MTSRELAGHVTIVTGGSRGIGRAIAEKMAARGAIVVVADLESSTGRELTDRIGGRFVGADVTRSGEVDQAVEATLAEFGRIDSLVNNAGITEFADFFDIDDDHWDRIHAVNSRGVFFFTRAAARAMRERGVGSIVNISSIGAKGFKQTSSAAYAASKGGVLGFTRVAAMQLARDGIRVNAVCPGVVETPLNAAWLTDNADRLEQNPLGTPCRPDDIAEAVAFLASDRARIITGQSLNVDGGIILD